MPSTQTPKMLPSQFHSPRFFHHWCADWRCAGRDSGTELFDFDSTNTFPEAEKSGSRNGSEEKIGMVFYYRPNKHVWYPGIPRFYHFNVGHGDQIKSDQ